MNQEKPWKSFGEQLAILKCRELQVDDDAKAFNYLERLGYYRLSGYLYPFRRFEVTKGKDGKLIGIKQVDDFIDGTHFKDAVHLYVWDKKLRLLALDALERIEMAVRVDVAHLLGKKDIYAHENANVFYHDFASNIRRSGKTAHQEWLDSYQRNLTRSRRLEFVKHYLDKYGKLPVWVSTEVWDFGLLSRLFSGMKREDQQAIAAKYGLTDGRVLASWLRSLNFIRNVSAHHSRLWNVNVLEYATSVQGEYWEQLKPERPFFYFCMMQKMMKIICPNSHWSERFEKLMDEFPEPQCKAVRLDDFGMIEDWKDWELWS
ncbi:MAG: Abi family protein [Ghiorsea sp.]|nr:Abi family protein [Ghiorsea sp.]